MNHQQTTSYRPRRRPNGFPAAGSLMTDGSARDQFGDVLEPAPDWLLNSNRVERMRIILMRERRFEPQFRRRRPADPRDMVDDGGSGGKYRMRPDAVAASTEERPAPMRQSGGASS